MNKIERQILENQLVMLDESNPRHVAQILETRTLLRLALKFEEPCCEMPEEEVEVNLNGKEQIGMSSMGIKIKDFANVLEDEEICKCGHHTKDHSYEPSDLSDRLDCDKCSCINFVPVSEDEE